MKAIFGNRVLYIVSCALLLACYFQVASLPARAQTPIVPSQPGQSQTEEQEAAERKALAEKQLKQQEHQRILGIWPAFNTSNVSDAVPLTAKQKFKLAFKSATDPATFGISAFTAGINMAQGSYHEYGGGVEGYAKYWGASYADSFDGTMLGNALFPALLREDPRYFRKGTGSFVARTWYAVISTVRCKDDSGRWVPNFGNVMGNLAAGGISNLYYPSEDRGVGLTFQRAAVVTAEGVVGAMLFEFWPDIVHKARKKKTP